MSDIEKKIAKYWNKMLSGSYSPEEYAIVKKAHWDITTLLDQLKACREELEEDKEVNKDWENFPNSKRLIDEIEQRTKEACINTGWNWIESKNGDVRSYSKYDFRQVINSAEVK